MSAKLEIVVVGVNIRSSYNVGSILRTCDGFGVKRFVAVGTTPYPELEDDQRLPHIKLKATKQITKTALGAEATVKVEYYTEFGSVAAKLKEEGFELVLLEQSANSKALNQFKPKGDKLALFLGPEVTGFSETELDLSDAVIEIAMSGAKESFNVSVAAGIALYQLSLIDTLSIDPMLRLV